jgi:hypothetical protein
MNNEEKLPRWWYFCLEKQQLAVITGKQCKLRCDLISFRLPANREIGLWRQPTGLPCSALKFFPHAML